MSFLSLTNFAKKFMSKNIFSAYISYEVFMKEVALACRVKNNKILKFLQTELKNQLDFCNIITTNYADNNFSYLLFAFDESLSQTIEKVIRNSIIEYVESIYKIAYLKKKIKNPINDNLIFNAYIKVLSIFDKSTDISTLEKIILFNQTFFIDSFLEFRLVPLKKHWDNLAELSSENLTIFTTSTLLDVIKFLLTTIDRESYKVKIVVKDDIFSIYNMQNKNSKIIKIAECDNGQDLISNIFNNCPTYIDVYVNSTHENDAVSFLSNVFSNRLKIYSKNI